MKKENSDQINKCGCGKVIPFRNSTIRQKLCPNCSLKALERSVERKLATFYKKADKVSPKTKDGLKRLKTASSEMKRADKYFSLFIRLKECRVQDGDAFCQDIITGKWYDARKIDNGHLISRYWPGTRYDENNCWPQNRSSNRFKGEADKDRFEQNVIQKIGNEAFEELMAKSKESMKKTYTEYAEYYRAKVNEIVKARGLKKWW